MQSEISKRQSDKRVSPDITSFSYFNGNGNSSLITKSSAPVDIISGKNGQCPAGAQFQSIIPEVPTGFYEFILADNGEIKIFCKICQYVSNKKSNFKRHFTNMHFVHDEDSAKVLECCGIRFSTKGEKFQHTKSVHKSGYKCTICSKVFDRPALLQRHLAKHTGKKPYKCSLCSYQTPNKANAKRHIEKKHADVQEGSILFVTDDGEQIQMEVIEKNVRDVSGGKTPPPVYEALNGEDNSNTTSIQGSSPPELKEVKVSSVSSFINLPRASPASTTVKSASSSPSTRPTSLDENLDQKVKVECDDKRRQITHSIQKIMSQPPANQQSRSFPGSSTDTSTRSGYSTIWGGSTISLENSEISGAPQPAAVPPPSFLRDVNHHNINELHLASSYHWSHSSSLLSVKNDFTVCKPQPLYYQQQCNEQYRSSNFPFGPPSAVNHESSVSTPSFGYRQCVYGCWHPVYNHNSYSQNAPDFPISSGTELLEPTPDLRSSSSISQQTENSSKPANHTRDQEPDEIIDVVGEGDNPDRKLLSTICDDLGKVATMKEEKEGCKGEDETQRVADGPPVEYQRSFSGNGGGGSGVASSKKLTDSTEEYVPKKLRVSRAYRMQ